MTIGELSKCLCTLNVVSSWEDEVHVFLLAEVEPRADRLRMNTLGNLIAWRRGRRHTSSKLLLTAHADEVGLMIRQIINDGYLKFDTMGATDRRVLLGKPVLVGSKRVPGVMGLKAYYLVSREEERSVPKLNEFYIDIGIRDRAGVEARVALGDTAASDSNAEDFGAGLFQGKALGSRLGCAMLLTLLRDELPMDCIFVFTAQKEVGAREAFGAVFSITPEVVLVADDADAADLAGMPTHRQRYSLGGGVVLPCMDRGAIADQGLSEVSRFLTEVDGIPWWAMRSVAGRTDTAAIQRIKEGVQVAAVSVPVRYPRAPSGATCLWDAEAALALTRASVGYLAEKEWTDMELIEILQALSACHGPSGSGGAVAGALRTLTAPYVGSCTTDALGNLICHKKGSGPKILSATHMNSTDLMVIYIDKKGFPRSGLMGGLFTHEVLGVLVRLTNGTRSMVTLEGKVEPKDTKLGHLCLDIGARNEAGTKAMVQVGDVVVYDIHAFCSGERIFSPYLDDRIACAVLLMTTERLENAENDLYFIFTVQEEAGLRGARTAVYGVVSDYGIAANVTGLDGVPSVLHVCSSVAGKGVVIKMMDSSVICHPSAMVKLEKFAPTGNVPCQRDILCLGGTDAGVIHQSRAGVYTGGISIPAHYVHTLLEVADLGDVEVCAALVAAFAQTKLAC